MLYKFKIMTIDKPYENLIEIKKSKFIAHIYPFENVEDVEKQLNDLRKQHKDSTHVCYAYVLSNPNLEKCSDDGEPDGTAGKPLLDVIKKNNLTDVLLVVVRYFGGIKLGAGGLVRAYSGAGSDVIKNCKFGEMKEVKTISITTDLKNAKKLTDYIRSHSLRIVGQEYSELFNMKVNVEDEDVLKTLSKEYKVKELEKSKVFYDKDI